MNRTVRVYKSLRRTDMYLFVDAEQDLEPVPETLLEMFGEPVESLVFELHAQRKLARAEPAEVMEQLQQAGYYLQMPPRPEGWSG